MRLPALCTFSLIALFTQPGAADVVTYHFSGSLPESLTTSIDPSLSGSITATGTHALFSTIAGTGFPRMVTGPIAGDFTAHAIAEPISLSPTATLGMALYYDGTAASSTFAALYARGDNTTQSIISAGSTHQVNAQYNGYPMTVDFVLGRAGNTVFTRYDDGVTVRELNYSSLLLSGPVRIGLFIADYGGSSQGQFDLLSIEGFAAFTASASVLEVPEPALLWPVSIGLTFLAATRRARPD